MGPIAATKSVFRNYATMSGRASRSEYWWWGLIHFCIVMVFGLISTLSLNPSWPSWVAALNGALLIPYVLATLVPNICVMVRRLHDTDRSGFWYFICFVPVIGGIWFLVLMLLGSSAGTNRFGPPPSGDGTVRRGKAPADDIYEREDVSNAYVAAYTTDPRVAAMRKSAVSGDPNAPVLGFQEQRKAEISDYYKTKVLGGLKPESPNPH